MGGALLHREGAGDIGTTRGAAQRRLGAFKTAREVLGEPFVFSLSRFLSLSCGAAIERITAPIAATSSWGGLLLVT